MIERMLFMRITSVTTIFHATDRSRRRCFRPGLRALGLAAGLLPFLLRADPTPSLDQLYVIDQGPQLSLIWHFYYKLLPAKFVLPQRNGVVISLADPSTRRQNLTDLAFAAFTLTIDGREAPPTGIAELTPAPDGGCFVTLLYRGHRKGRLELRDNLLPVYPASYVMNYEIYNPWARAEGVSGYFTGGAASPVISYTQRGSGSPPTMLSWLDGTPVALFKSELRAAWINANWLLMCLLLLLTQFPRRALRLGLALIAGWVLPTLLWLGCDAQLPFALPAIVPGLATVAICLLTRRAGLNFAWIAGGLAAAGILDACYDIQQTTLERPAPTPGNLLGFALGFVASLALIFLIGIPLVGECRRQPGFTTKWAPKICWGLAALALILPFLPAG